MQNHAEEINEELSASERKFPAIYLDTSFAPALQTFTRKDLLEISRSCRQEVLQKLGKILTHLVYVESPEKLPENFKESLSIPTSLGIKVFTLLLHLVLPGTKLSFRLAAIVASLCRTLKITFLEEAAKAILDDQKGKWLNLGYPENFNLECIRILLFGAVLTEIERTTFENMQRYKMVELNMDTELEVQVPWTPEKSVGPVGEMAVSGMCGLCACPPEDCYGPESSLSPAAKKGVTKGGEGTWVECSVTDFKVHYQVLNPHLLNVKPKCYYCRKGLTCPSIGCVKCRNKIIPEKYGEPGKGFICVFCQKGTKTTVEEKVIVKDLVKDIGTTWIGIPE
ncbi:hypothetical protein RUND412_010620 [Rhizina undulata]